MNGNIQQLLNKGEGESFWVLGDLYTFKATGKQTNGAYTVIEQIIQPQNGPPPHIHHGEDEAFYVLNGKFSFLCGDKETPPAIAMKVLGGLGKVMGLNFK